MSETQADPAISQPALAGPPPVVGAEGWNLLFWALFASLVALCQGPVWLPDAMPMADAAAHLHIASLLHDWDISALIRDRYAQADVLVPGAAWYHAAGALAWIGGIEWAVRVLVSLSVALLPVAALYLLQTLGQSRWLVLAMLPWALNARFFSGDFPFLASMPMFIWLLATHARLLRRPTLATAVFMACLMMVLAATHHLLWLMALFVLPLLAAWTGAERGWRSALTWPLREMLVALPSMAMLLPWLLAQTAALLHPLVPHSPAMVAPLANSGEGLYAATHGTPVASIQQLLQGMFARFSGSSGEVSGALDLLLQRPGELASGLWILGVALWIAATWRSRTGPISARCKDPAYVGKALLVLVVLYFLLPRELSRPLPLGAMSPRLVPILAILFIASLPLRPLPRTRIWSWAGAVCIVACTISLPLQTTGAFMLAGAEHGSMRQAFSRIPSERSVLTLSGDVASVWLKGAVWRDPGAWYSVYQGGYSPADFGRLGPIVLAERPERAMPRPKTNKQKDFKVKAHGRYYDYVVIQRPHGSKPGPWERGLRGWHRIYQRDRWQVHQNPQPAEWPIPTRKQLQRRAKTQRIAEMLLEWIGLGIPEDRVLSAHAFMGLLGVELPEPEAPPVPEPFVPEGGDPPSVPIPGLDIMPAPEPVLVPGFQFLPQAVSPGMMPNIAPPAMVPMLRPLFGPELKGMPQARSSRKARPDSARPTAAAGR